MKTREMIKELEGQINDLEAKIRKIRRVIEDLETLDNNSEHAEPASVPKARTTPKKNIDLRTNSEAKEKARKLLEEGKLTLAQIAYRCGCNKTSFYNWFDMSKFKKSHEAKGDACAGCGEIAENGGFIDTKYYCLKCWNAKKNKNKLLDNKEEEE